MNHYLTHPMPGLLGERLLHQHRAHQGVRDEVRTYGKLFPEIVANENYLQKLLSF